MPPLDSLRLFETSIRLGSFTLAAREHGITQGAVSLRMRNLQADLGVALFERTRPRPIPTETGRLLASHVGEAMALLRQAVDATRIATASVQLSATPTFAARWLAPRLGDFTSARVTLDVSPEPRTVGSGGVDLAIRSGLGAWPGLDAQLLMPIERTPMLRGSLMEKLGTSPDAASLAALPLLPDDAWPRWFAAAGAAGLRPHYTLAAYPSQDLSAQAVLTSDAVALLSPTLFGSLIQSGELIAPFATVLTGPDAYYAIYPREGRSAATDALITWLIREAGVSASPAG